MNSRNLKADSEFYGMTPLIMNATQKNDCAEVTELLINAGLISQQSTRPARPHLPMLENVV